MPAEDHESHDAHTDPFEDRLGLAMRQAGGSFETDRSALAAGGAVRGRRFLLRRRAAVAGGVAAVALVGVGGTLLVPWGGEADGRQSVAAGRTTPTAPTENAGQVSGADLVRTLKSLLPEGEFSEEQGRDTGAESLPYARVVFDDGKGKGAVSVSLNRVEPGSEQARQVTECPDKALVPYDHCTTSELADGSALKLFQGYEYPDRRVDTKWWTADLVTPQGQHISVSEWNAAAEKDAPVSRVNPPLSTDQLKQVVTAAAWRAAVDAIPENPKAQAPGTTPSTPPGADGAAVGQTLASLLPQGVEVVSKGGQETEYANVVVDDGKGKSLVQINVQHGMSDVEDQLFGADAETLPDGTKVATHQGPGEKGGAGVVMWTVDTIGTDGMRVVVSAFNSGTQHDAATRETPALTMKQLRDIATSAKWRQQG
ncbi:hypothetical protein G5C60_20315 [Streptomyces sp. HC44]|uniref:LigA protein n=1 Tax=Streptomyces scabichelini TaxID=2711217 RepID=A0A6G4V714_9ACTN|nr:hypothetical protein [Streptomyces scabichelini]NGO09882.1 hypothetical protein [Streptomyces scabichelini]